MDNQISIEAAQFFGGAFAESFAEALTQACGSPWQIEPLEKADPDASQKEPIYFRLTVDGSLHGECFVGFNQSEAAEIGSKILARPVAVFDEEQAAALAGVITSTMEGLIGSLSPEYGPFTIEVEKASGLSAGEMFLVPLTATGGELPVMSILLHFDSQLMEAFTPPPAEVKPAAAEKENLQKDTQTGPSQVGSLQPECAPTEGPQSEQANLKLVMDVELNVTLRFGQRQLPLRDVLELTSGSVVELDRVVDDPVELLLDGKVIAWGEVVIVDGNYGLRVTEIPQPMASHFTRLA